MLFGIWHLLDFSLLGMLFFFFFPWRNLSKDTLWIDQSRKKEATPVSGNTSLHNQTWNSILFFERPIKVKVTHFWICVCLFLRVFLITLHMDHLPFYNRDCSQRCRRRIHHSKPAFSRNTFSCPSPMGCHRRHPLETTNFDREKYTGWQGKM